MISQTDILIRICLAAVFGALVGLERERQNQPAGLRTHTILAVGSALAMTLSINMAIQFRPFAPNGDPARLAAQVVSGIGFLGAGAILRYGTNIKGLTTATSLWTVAIVGLAIGAGELLAALGATALILVILVVLNWIEKNYIHAYDTHVVTVILPSGPSVVDDFRRTLQGLGHGIISVNVSKDFTQDQVTLEAVIKTMENPILDPLVETLSAFPGIKSFRIV